MIVYDISDYPGLFGALDGCKAGAALVMPDGKAYGWNENRELIRSLIESTKPGSYDRLEIKLQSNKDIDTMLRYMYEAAIGR